MPLFIEDINYELEYPYIKEFLSSAKTVSELQLYTNKAMNMSYTSDKWPVDAIEYFSNKIEESINSVVVKNNKSKSTVTGLRTAARCHR